MIYDENSIVRLDPMQHIRMRPKMFFGDDPVKALHHLIFEVMDFSIDEVNKGHCDHIWITLRPEHEVCVQDNGSGLSTRRHSPDDMTELEMFMSQIATPGPRRNLYYVSGGLHGVGIQAVNAVSTKLKAETMHNGVLWQQTYKEGVPQGDVIQVRPLEKGELNGTIISFTPDFTILEKHELDFDIIKQRCRDAAYTIPGLIITLRDERTSLLVERGFCYENGIYDLLEELNRGKKTLHTIISGSIEVKLDADLGFGDPYHWQNWSTKSEVDFAFQYTDDVEIIRQSYVNTLRTTEDGPQCDGFIAALTDFINQFCDDDFSRKEVLSGMTLVINIKHNDPKFESQKCLRLLNSDMYPVMTMAVYGIFERRIRDEKLREAIISRPQRVVVD